MANSADDPIITEQTAEALPAGEDLGGLDARAIAAALASTVAHTRGAAKEGAGLLAELVRIAAGRSVIAPERGDWRFTDPTWTENPLYRRLGQTYLAWAGAVQRFVDNAQVDWKTAEQARFATSILTSLAAPTNTLLGNPVALKRAFETGGLSILRGFRNFAHDVLYNGGMPNQVDRRPFKVGRNLAATPGAVVHRSKVCEVLQYNPTTASVYERPVVMIVPQINKYYFMDLAPGRSFVEYAVSRGIQLFAISWRNPTAAQGHWNLDTYVGACLEALEVAREITRSETVNTLGLCAGGITAATMLSHLAANGDARVGAASFAVTLLDFSVPAPIGVFLSPRLLELARSHSSHKGVLPSRDLARVFSWMRPNDLVWNYWVNNYLLGKDPPAFDILAWNSDGTRLPAALHAQFLELFEHNLLCQPGGLRVLGGPVDLRRIECDTFVTGASTDHLTPWKGCYRTTQLVGGQSEFVLSNAGHIQSLVNPPGNPKARMFVGPEPGPDPDVWRSQATERPGTWWERWAEWMIARSGEERPAPNELGSRKFPAREPAPGRYVHQS